MFSVSIKPHYILPLSQFSYTSAFCIVAVIIIINARQMQLIDQYGTIFLSLLASVVTVCGSKKMHCSKCSIHSTVHVTNPCVTSQEKQVKTLLNQVIGFKCAVKRRKEKCVQFLKWFQHNVTFNKGAVTHLWTHQICVDGMRRVSEATSAL